VNSNLRARPSYNLLFTTIFCSLGYVAIFVVNQLLPPFFAGILFGRADIFPYTFQMGMWLPFFLGLHTLSDYYLDYKLGTKYFNETCEPISEQTILGVEHFKRWLEKVKPYLKEPVATAPRVIHQVILKYQSSKSAEQASSMLSSLLENIHHRLDLRFGSIRYLSWLIPSLGFMGTVYGISLAVSAMGSSAPDDPELLSNMAGKLAIAFDTTLLALIQSSILIYIANVVESGEEGEINRLGDYVLEHVINRLG